MQHDVGRVRDETSGVSLGLSRCRDGFGTEPGMSHNIAPVSVYKWPHLSVALTGWAMLAHMHVLLCVLTWADMILAVVAVLFGMVVGTICNFMMQLKFLLQYDNCLDMHCLCCVQGSSYALFQMEPWTQVCACRYAGACGRTASHDMV